MAPDGVPVVVNARSMLSPAERVAIALVVSVALNVPPPVVVTVAVTVVTVGVIAVVFWRASALNVSSAVAVRSIL